MSGSSYCASSSRTAGESVAGTAAEGIDAWIVLEVADAWAAKPIETEVLAGSRRARIEAWLSDIPRSRLQLVRRPQSMAEDVSLFLASSAPGAGWAARIKGGGLDEICDLDVPELFAQRGGPTAEPVKGLILVCTHGKRDRCCAKFGMTIFCEAVAREPELVWQTSHLGGHRFAATALSLPAGICYGRLEERDVEAWLEAESRGEIFDISKVRGRTAYPRHVQAAEIMAWDLAGVREQDALTLAGDEARDGDCWSVHFRGPESMSVELCKQSTGASCLGSCGDDEPRAVVRYVRG